MMHWNKRIWEFVLSIMYNYLPSIIPAKQYNEMYNHSYKQSKWGKKVFSDVPSKEYFPTVTGLCTILPEFWNWTGELLLKNTGRYFNWVGARYNVFHETNYLPFHYDNMGGKSNFTHTVIVGLPGEYTGGVYKYMLEGQDEI